MITPSPTWRRSSGHQLLVLDGLAAEDAGFRRTLTGPASRFLTEEPGVIWKRSLRSA